MHSLICRVILIHSFRFTSRGGAIYLNVGSSLGLLTGENSIISSNVALRAGGAVYEESGAENNYIPQQFVDSHEVTKNISLSYVRRFLETSWHNDEFLVCLQGNDIRGDFAYGPIRFISTLLLYLTKFAQSRTQLRSRARARTHAHMCTCMQHTGIYKSVIITRQTNSTHSHTLSFLIVHSACRVL